MKKQHKTLTMWIVILLFGALITSQYSQKPTHAKKINYSDFITAVEGGNVKEVTFKGRNTIQGSFVDGYENGMHFSLTGNTGDETFKILREKGIVPNYKEEEKDGLLETIFISWFPMLLLIDLTFLSVDEDFQIIR